MYDCTVTEPAIIQRAVGPDSVLDVGRLTRIYQSRFGFLPPWLPNATAARRALLIRALCEGVPLCYPVQLG